MKFSIFTAEKLSPYILHGRFFVMSLPQLIIFLFQANGLACMGQYKEGEFKSAAAADSLFVAKHAY